MKQVCIRLDDAVYKKLRVYCFTHGVTMTSALQGLINGLIAIEPPLPRPPKQPVAAKPFDNTSLSKSYQARKVKKH